MDILFYFFLILNVVAFLITGYDKLLAIQQKRRISERMLLSFTFIGGIIGSGLAMLLFRHKIAKASYLFKFSAILIIQIIILFWIYKS